MRRRISLNQIVTLLLTLFTLCVIGAVTWFFYHQEKTILLREMQRHGFSLAENLAYNSEYQLLFSDIEGLNKLVAGVVQDKDVLFAIIVDTEGSIVAERAMKRFPKFQRKALERLNEILELLQTEHENPYSPTLYFTENYEGIYLIFAPVFVPTLEQELASEARIPGPSPVPAEQRELLGLTVVGISFERISALLKDIQKQVIGLALFIVLLAVIAARFLVNTISRPVEKLAEGTRRIARGDLSQEVEVKTPSEIGELAHSFNQMMRELQTTHQELELWAQTLENRVQERTREIQEKNQRLTELIEKMKKIQEQLVHSEKMASLGQLVAGIAHEINNPVNFISSNMTPLKQYVGDLKTLLSTYEHQMSLDADADSEIAGLKEEIEFDFLMEDLDDLLRDIESGAGRIKRIVQDLRNFSRLDEAELKTIDIHEGLDTTLNLLGHLYENRITVHKHYGTLPAIECYAGQLNQVFMNLLANAAQAFDRKGNVWIRTWQEGESILISIRDDGPGIPEEILPKIFDPFFTTKDVGDGTGLGLSISYGIIEKHQGHITVTSRRGEGTEFRIRIPQKLSEHLSFRQHKHSTHDEEDYGKTDHSLR